MVNRKYYYRPIKVRNEYKKDKLNNYCYFCDFSVVIHVHHIMPLSWGGTNDEDNLISLCPNCHSMIHKGHGVLSFNGEYYFLVKPNTHEVIYKPNKRQLIKKRELPIGSVNNCLNNGEVSLEEDLSDEELIDNILNNQGEFIPINKDTFNKEDKEKVISAMKKLEE